MKTEDNEYIAHVIMGLVPCDEWGTMNFGSAGGPALTKRCDHTMGKCYPRQPIGSIHVTIGGLPDYSQWRYCEGLIKHLRECDHGVLVRVGWPPYEDMAGGHVGGKTRVASNPWEAVALAAIDYWKDNHGG